VCSRGHRACCSTSGAASIHTPPGARPPSTTLMPSWLRPAPPTMRLGVMRIFTTRHGAGPMVTEDPTLTAALVDPHNPTGEWQGAFPGRALRRRGPPLRRRGLRRRGRDRAHPPSTRPRVPPHFGLCRSYLIDGNGGGPARNPDPSRDLDHQEALTARLLAAPAPTGPRAAVLTGSPRSRGPSALRSCSPRTARRPRTRRLGWMHGRPRGDPATVCR